MTASHNHGMGSIATPARGCANRTALFALTCLIFSLVLQIHEGYAKPAPSGSDAREPQPRFDPSDSTLEAKGPSVLTVVVPDTTLGFEFGKSTLKPPAERFLSETMPHYATIVCGVGRQEVESFVIEGHTDDLSDDRLNLKLSQDRSFAVLTKSLEVIREKLPWAYECFLQKATATGRGGEDFRHDPTGGQDRERNRHVIFKIHLRQTRH